MIILIPVHAHVNDNRTLFYIFCRNKLLFPDRYDKDVRAFCHFLQIFRPGMRDRYSPVSPGEAVLPLASRQYCSLPITTHSLPSIAIPDRFRSWMMPAGVRKAFFADPEPAHADRMEPVYIFVR